MDTISYIDRKTNQVKTEEVPGKRMMKWLYHSPTGKAALHLLLKRKIFSVFGGWYMDRKISARRIKKFVDRHKINMEEFKLNETSHFSSFNHFFVRELKEGMRYLGEHIVSPADGKILAFQSLGEISTFFVKGHEFTLQSFLRNKQLADKYKDGAMIIVRLAPVDYHRFHFPASGTISRSVKIKGKYFSVSPLALKNSLKIFCQNYREYSILTTREYGEIIISEVGATMVGSIAQTYRPNKHAIKGHEKGYFSFGGSTVVLLFEKDKIVIDNDLLVNTKKGFETSVKMGENIAS